jgi:hypothetical protein
VLVVSFEQFSTEASLELFLSSVFNGLTHVRPIGTDSNYVAKRVGEITNSGCAIFTRDLKKRGRTHLRMRAIDNDAEGA